jgi:charged multivesicular body protein 7
VDRIFSREAFERTFARALNSSQDLTTSDFSVLLRFLERDLKAIACDGEVSMYIMFLLNLANIIKGY